MATVLESLTVPRTSPFPSASLSPISSSSTTSSLSSPSNIRLPEFKGLKASSATRTTTAPIKSVSSRSGFARRASRIVSESSSEAALSVPAVDDESWKPLVLDCDLPVLVEFWAPWCGPCRIIQPVIDELSREYAGKLRVYKVNTDQSPTIASDFGVRSIPTVIIFKNGEKKEAIIGAVPKTTLTTSIEKFL